MAICAAVSSPPAAAPVTAEMRLAYVWRHFCLAYEGVPNVALGYAGQPGQVQIATEQPAFFSASAPHPGAPNWRAWRGQPVPFFFDAQPARPLLTYATGHATIGADIIAGAFYLLSGWQEYFSVERDQHGRFPYAASVQARHGFVALPVVNYYFDVLKTAVEHVTGQPIWPRRWAGGAPFAAFISHDVDSLHGGWGALVHQLRHLRHYPQLLQTLWACARRRTAPWNNLEHVQAEMARYGAPATFFILGNNQLAPNGVHNADYVACAPAFQRRLARLAAAGAEIASHGSYGTATEQGPLRAEIAAIFPAKLRGNRFHYLGWEPTRTPQVLAAAGVRYDATLGFAEHYGFRHSYCQPFFPFDFQRGQAVDFLEIPLHVMDATLHHPNYLQLGPTEILPALQPLLAEVEKFGGVASVLWHNQNFDPANPTTGPRQFHEIMAYLAGRGAAFCTGAQITDEICGLPAAP